jgi:hydrogenase maturation protease
VVPPLAYLAVMLIIVGCGNSNRCDDGVGVYVAQSLAGEFGQASTGVRIIDAGTGGLEVMFQARGASELVIVDACRTGAEPGAIFRVPGDELASDYTPTFTLHDFRWDHALAAGRRIFRESFPTDVTVYLIEAGSLDFGLELSQAVSSAAGKVIDEITRRVRGHVVA